MSSAERSICGDNRGNGNLWKSGAPLSCILRWLCEFLSFFRLQESVHGWRPGLTRLLRSSF